MMHEQHNKALAVWLLTCCALIFVMVVLGGVTRLTRSGLSMVEWEPIMGVIPPLSAAQWEETFAKYRRTPEYKNINRNMTLEGFKFIFWFEYAHRLLGRLIGLAFLLPFLYFLIRKRIHRKLVPRFTIMFVLGGLQGLLGWYMVKSGLVHDPHVSPYRLTAHLGFAVVIYAYIFWVALGLLRPEAGGGDALRPLRRFGITVTGLIFLMILSGGFVAGTKAGFAFNTFPLMNGQWLPEGMYALEPVWTNLFENLATVQFNHRALAYILMLTIPAYWLYARRFTLAAQSRLAFHALLAMLAVQVGLGIATLLLIVPTTVAAAHQAGALALFTLALYLNHDLHAASSEVG